MAGKKKTTKQRPKKNPVMQALSSFIIILIFTSAGALVWVICAKKIEEQRKIQAEEMAEKKRLDYERANPPPRMLVNDSVPETVRYAASKGWVPCPGNCLKLATPGWHHKDIAGYPPTYIWQVYNYNGGWQRFSQNHLGHIIREHYDKPAQDVGVCPICKGSGWVRQVPKPNTGAAPGAAASGTMRSNNAGGKNTTRTVKLKNLKAKKAVKSSLHH